MMSRARGLVLSVFVFGLFAAALPAQIVRNIEPGFSEPFSHRRLGGGFEDMTNPEAALAQRLTMSRLQRLKKEFGDKPLEGDLAKLAEKLLRDEKFLESLKGQFRPEDLERLKAKFRDGKLTANDKGFRDLLDKAKTSEDISQRDKTALDQIAQKLPDQVRPDAGRDLVKTNWEAPVPPKPQELSGATPWQRDPSRSNDWLKGGLDGFVKNMDQWVDTPSGKSWAESLKNLANRADSGRASTAKLSEQTSALSGWLGKIGGNSNFRPPQLGNPSLPNLPNVGVPSGGSLAGSSSVLVVLLFVLLIGLILWRGRDWFTTLKGARHSTWKLGPWPVRPENVTTRGDLVRAFEYLALLCLGPTARTCHHLELGQRIGGQPALDAERRHEAAAALSRIYEQARYTPDQEPLPGEDLRRARRELAYLAGAKA